VSGGDELQSVSQGGVDSDVGERLESGRGDGDVFFLAPVGKNEEGDVKGKRGKREKKKGGGRVRLEGDSERKRKKVALRNSPNLNDLSNLLHSVTLSRDDEDSIEQIDGDSMRGFVLCSTNSGDASVGSHDDQRSEVVLECSVEEGEAFDVEHVDFVDEEDLGNWREEREKRWGRVRSQREETKRGMR